MQSLKKAAITLGVTAIAFTVVNASEEWILPMDSINTVKSCKHETYEGFKGKLPTGDIDVATVWFEAVNDAVVNSNATKLKHLTKPRTKYEMNSNLIDIKNGFHNSKCRNAVDKISLTFQRWNVEAKKIANKSSISTLRDLYIVSSSNGVNVRSSPMYGTRGRIIDSLKRGTGLELVEKVDIDIKNSWARFIYTSQDGIKRLGWIHMANVSPSIYSSN